MFESGGVEPRVLHEVPHGPWSPERLRAAGPQVGSSVAAVRFRFRSELWLHPGDAAWHFVTLPFDVADEIEEISRPVQRGFGSVKVRVTIGATTWSTSLFPDSKARSYLLPVKKPVRTAEHLAVGDPIDVEVELVEI